MAEMAVLSVYFEHLLTGVSGVGERDINPGVPGQLVVCNPPWSSTSAPCKSGLMTPEISRHPRVIDSFQHQFNYTR
jgi:hypothetical protein